MSLLSQEQQEALIEQLSGAAEAEPPEELEAEELVEEYEEEGEAEEYEAEAEYEEEEEADPESEDEEVYETSSEEAEEEEYEEEVAEGHRVPYERFRKVNQHRRDLESRLEAREAQLAELQSRRERSSRGSQERRDYENHNNDLENDVAWGAPSGENTPALQELQVRVAQMELDKEIKAAIEEYPEVPADFLWESIAQNGTQRASDLAAGYSSFVAEVEERAIARFLEEAREEEEEHAQNSPAPPRVASRRTVRSQEAEVEHTLTLDQAKEAMIAYLKDT